MAAAQEEAFIAAFKRAAEHIGTAPAARDRAASALADLYPIYRRQVLRAPAAAPFYAEHGENHGVRLGQIAADFLTQQVSGPPSDWGLRGLLIAYASFLFHDIGMSILPRGETFEDASKEQRVRHDHDERSLEFIENNFIDNPSHYAAWSTFWSEVGPDDWPTPAGRYAFIVLARICKSHGDDPAIWLQEDSLDYYDFRTRTEKVSFPSVWHDQWPSIRHELYAAATLLSLCDLCEIGPERFIDAPQDWSDLALPTSPASRTLSLMHLVGHQVSSVKFAKNDVLVQVAGYGGHEWASLMAIYCGAVSDLLTWGTHQIIVDRIRQYINPKFQGVRIVNSPNADDVWQEIGSRLRHKDFSTCWSNHHINCATLGTSEEDPLDERHALSLIYRCLATDLLRDISDDEQHYFYKMILHLMQRGLIIDAFTSIGEVERQSRIFDTGVAGDDVGEVRLSRFVVAFALVRQILINYPARRFEIRYAYHGSAVFRDLLEGRPSSRSAIYLCEVRDPQPGDVDNYRKIIASANGGDAETYVVFTGLGVAGVHSELLPELTQVQSASRSEVMERILQNQGSRISEWQGQFDGEFLLGEAGVEENRDLTAGKFLLELWRRGAGLDGFVTSINRGLSDFGSSEYWRAASRLVVVTLVDVMAGGAPALVAKVAVEYNNFALRFGGGLLQSWREVSADLPNEMYEGDEQHLNVPPAFLEGTSLQPEARRGGRGWLIQLVAWSVIHGGNLFNPQSEAARGIPVRRETASSIVGQILDGAVVDDSMVRLGIAMGDFLGRHLVREKLSFSWFSALFPKASFDMSRRDCLAFQMAYRAARHAFDGGIFEASSAPPATSVTLGILEAACRQARREGRLTGTVEAALDAMLDALQSLRGPKGHNARIVAFDILWKYGAEAPILLERCKAFLDAGIERRWNDLADYFHGRNPHLTPELTRNGDYQKWLVFRTNFGMVLENTEVELKRNAPAALTIQPLQSSGSAAL
ncbi:MAG TPA: hypothetical protein VF605_18525 [Allosphingosinicella sp.]|jgi:hypothetical protein